MLKNAARALAVPIIAVATGYALWYGCVLPFQCNRTEQRAETATFFALTRADPTEESVMARHNLEHARECLRVDPTKVNLYMIAAANYRILRRPAEAMEMYERALRYDRRPEIYLQLGLTQLESGQRDQAIESLTVSNIYYPDKLDLIPLPDVRSAVAGNTRAFFAAGRNATLPRPLRSNRETW